MFSGLKGIIILDSLGDLDKYEKQIEELRNLAGLPILERKEIGLESLRQNIMEAVIRHEEKTRASCVCGAHLQAKKIRVSAFMCE
jgi:hypothetical protein